MTTTKEQIHNENYLCTLENGRDIFKGDSVYHIRFKRDRIAESIFVDVDGDKYLYFEDGGSAWIDGPFDTTQSLR